MRLSGARRPSVGFVLLLGLTTVAVSFFWWGFRTPPLEKVWRMDIELSLGQRPPLSHDEFDLLQNALRNTPELASFLAEDSHAGLVSAHDGARVEGKYAYLIRKAPGDPGLLRVSYHGSKAKGSVSIRAQTSHLEKVGTANRTRAYTWKLPDDGPYPQLVEVLIGKGRTGSHGKMRRHPVEIDIEAAP